MGPDSRMWGLGAVRDKTNNLLAGETGTLKVATLPPPRLYDLRPKAEPLWSLSLFVQGKGFGH